MPRQIAQNMSFQTAEDHLSNTAVELEVAAEDGDQEVGSLVGRIQALIDEWSQLESRARRLRFALRKANARVRRRDRQADRAVRDLRDGALAQVKLDREAPLFRRFFPAPVSVVTQQALGSQLRPMRDLHAKLLEAATPPALREAHERPIADVISRGDAALQQRQQVLRDTSAHAAAIADWRARANQGLLAVEGELGSIAAARKLDRAWVAAFFTRPRPAATRATPRKPTEQPAATPTPRKPTEEAPAALTPRKPTEEPPASPR